MTDPRPGLARLLRVLADHHLDPAAEEVADCLWLTARILCTVPAGPAPPRLEPTPPPRPSPIESTPARPPPGPGQAKPGRYEPPAPAPAGSEETVALHRPGPTPKPAPDDPALPASPFRAPGVTPLPQALDLSRALRPLRRRIPARRARVLDLDATVQQIADRDLWVPVTRPRPEPWLDLDLWIDDSRSMVIWRPLVRALHQLLLRQDAFGQVRCWSLGLTADAVALRPAAGRPRTPAPAANPLRRRLVWVLSDGVAAPWGGAGPLAARLRREAGRAPLTLVLLLPQRMWPLGALGAAAASPLSLRSAAPAQPNARLIADLHPWPKDAIRLPVITLDPHAVRTWGALIEGRAGTWCAGLAWPPPAPERPAAPTAGAVPAAAPCGAERLAAFRGFASPAARRLAQDLAVLPLNLPIMRLAQQVLMGSQGRLTQLAEVFLGGILERADLGLPEAERETDPERIPFDFIDDIRERLLADLPPALVQEIDRRMAAAVEQRLGQVSDFYALIAQDGGRLGLSLDARALPFARIRLKVLRRLGGSYFQRAVDLQARIARFEAEQAEGPAVAEPPRPIPNLGDLLRDATRGPAMVWLPGGTFNMGQDDGPKDDEKPAQNASGVQERPADARAHLQSAGEDSQSAAARASGAQGGVAVGGDFVGRDQIKAQGTGSVALRDAEHLIVITGDGNRIELAVAEANPETLLAAYYRDLADECSRLPLGVVDPRFAQPGRRTEVDLPGVYTDLHVVTVPREEGEDERRYGLRLARAEAAVRTPLLEAVTGEAGARLVLVGDAGSGKSTFIDYLTWRLADALVEGTRAGLPPVLRGLLPVRLVLRRAAAVIPADGAPGSAETLWEALADDCRQRLGQAGAARLFPYLKGRLLTEGALILLDGLDQVPESGARRAHLVQAVQRLAAALPAGSRVLLSARPYAYADPCWRLDGFLELALAPFDADQVAGFIDHWYLAARPVMGWDAATAAQRGADLRQAIRQHAYLGDLASRPLLLTLMATLHSSWGQLPRDRANLYEESVTLLMTRWQTGHEVARPDGSILREPGIARVLGLGEQALRQALDRLAFVSHERQAARTGCDEAPADIARDQVIATFSALCPADLNPRVLLDYLETRAGLLIARREGVYAFPHRSFQEYLAACHLANTAADFGAELRRRVWADPDWWREVYLLGVGKKRQGGLGDAVNLVNTLVPESPADTAAIGERHWQAAVLGAKALLDLGFPDKAADQDYFQAVLRRIRRWLVELLGRGALAAKERVEAGDLLGLLGDPRPGVGLGSADLPDIDWCEVPAGPFTLGSAVDDAEASDDERPAHRLDLPAFSIARYPITNVQFRPFVAAGGYDQECWWTPEGWAWRQGASSDLSAIKDDEWRKRYLDWLAQRPQGLRDHPYWWHESPWNGANRPVVGVSWHEALAYCSWLQAQLQAGRPGLRIGLPSEAQWEKAARGADARRWAWGDGWQDDRANTREAGLETTSPVGCFPAGPTPCDALDMTGNVWEWTCSRWGGDIMRPDFGYPYDPDDGRESLAGPDPRVLRGGSWNYVRRVARSASRDRLDPGGFNRSVGLRVVLSLADSGF